MGKILENMATKGANPELPAFVETVVVDNSEPESKVEEPEVEVVAKLGNTARRSFLPVYRSRKVP